MIEIREHVREACRRPENVLGAWFFDEHLAVVAEVALRLAGPLGADRRAVELAAWLHDFSAVLDVATLPMHAGASADLARELLAGEGPVGPVVDAIARHSEPLAMGEASPEAVCLSNADAAARILRPAYWLWFAFAVRRMPFDQGRQWLHALFERQWGMMMEPAREIVGKRYRAALSFIA